jgi:hypothetical protein
MFIYIPESLSVDEAKAIATQLFAIAFEQEETKLLKVAHHRNTVRQQTGFV